MWSRLYRNHVIMAFPTYDTVANAWAPQVDINWFAGSCNALARAESASAPAEWIAIACNGPCEMAFQNSSASDGVGTACCGRKSSLRLPTFIALANLSADTGVML